MRHIHRRGVKVRFFGRRVYIFFILSLIASEQGQQKDLKGRTFYAVLHQYEEKEHRAAAEKLVELLRRQGIEHVLVTCATGNRRQSGENTNPWYGRAELPVREAEEEWEPGE